MPKITIIELYNHSEVLLNLIRLFSETNYELLIISTTQNDKELAGINEWEKVDNKILNKEQQSFKEFFKYFNPILKETDLLIVLTATSHYHLWSNIVKPFNSLLLIHNANTYLNDDFQHIQIIDKNFYDSFLNFLRWGRSLIKNEKYAKKEMLGSFKKITFLADSITNFVLNSEVFFNDKIYKTLPNTYILTNFPKPENDCINIVIPGTITENGKDYRMVYSAFEKCIVKFNKQVKLTLLGKPRKQIGSQIVDDFKKLQNDIFTIEFFNESIPRIQFEEKLLKADFLILPIDIIHSFGIYQEQFGFTNFSGTINDAIYGLKPTLISKLYPIDNYPNIFKTYDGSVEFETILLDWVNNSSYKNIENQLNEKLVIEYSFENQVNNLNKFISDLI
ncbi:MAG: hypothetical protein IPL95_04415 [Saprospiraceae bacterium]|nr:hypothetical protein [Saprospiraceae bacterium]